MGLKNNAHNGGTRCLECSATNSSVIDSRPTLDGFTRRRRKCNACGHRWPTIEIPERSFTSVDLGASLASATRAMNLMVAEFNNLRRAVRRTEGNGKTTPPAF